MKGKWIVAGAVCVCLIASLGFIRYQQKKSQEAQAAEAIKDLRFGLSSEGYKKFIGIKSKALHLRKLSDSELEWTLALLKPSLSYIGHLRIFAMLELLGNAPPSQKEKIKAAIAPYMKENDPRYRNSMKRIQKFVFDNPDW
jgi:hypothetical protein